MFISKDFTFDSIDNSDYNVILVEFDSDILNEIGVVYKRDITREDGSTYNPTFNVENGEPGDIVLNLMLVDNNMIPKVWSEEDIINVKKWIIKDEFKPFISQDNPDYIYYFQCSNIRKKFTSKGEGALEVTFKPMDCFVYKKYSKTITVDTTASLSISNPTNEDYFPIIEITNKGDNSTINKINELEIEGLNKDEGVIIDNLMLTVLNGDINKFKCCNRKWIKLNPGMNTLNLSGNCQVKILAEFPIML